MNKFLLVLELACFPYSVSLCWYWCCMWVYICYDMIYVWFSSSSNITAYLKVLGSNSRLEAHLPTQEVVSGSRHSRQHTAPRLAVRPAHSLIGNTAAVPWALAGLQWSVRWGQGGVLRFRITVILSQLMLWKGGGSLATFVELLQWERGVLGTSSTALDKSNSSYGRRLRG